ncbi:MAG: hypothetical protein ACOCWQ_05000 [Nanoarchaeota archaeon]
MAKEKFSLAHVEAELGSDSQELAKVIIQRIGLEPRKRGSTDNMHQALLEFYERAKVANQQKDPKKAVMTVEEMAMYAGITRQTMYEYLGRWLKLNIITKVSFINGDGSVTIGYRLHGTTLEDAFRKAKTQVVRHLDLTERYIGELQKTIKNEKISKRMQKHPETKEPVHHG